MSWQAGDSAIYQHMALVIVALLDDERHILLECLDRHVFRTGFAHVFAQAQHEAVDVPAGYQCGVACFMCECLCMHDTL